MVHEGNRNRPYSNFIREHIKKQGYTIQDIAEKTGIPRRTLTNYLSGLRPIPRDYLKKLARTLRCSINDLLPESVEHASSSLQLATERQSDELDKFSNDGIISEKEIDSVEKGGVQNSDCSMFPLCMLDTEKVSLLASWLGLGNDIMASSGQSNRENLRRIATILGLAATSLQAIAASEPQTQSNMTPVAFLSRNIPDLDLVDNYTEALSRLLAQGEASYVMRASQNVYHKLMQEFSSSRDIRLAHTLFRLGMLVGTAQEYTLPWYQRDQAVVRTYNDIEKNIVRKFELDSSLRHDYVRLLAKRGRQYRVLWLFEESIKECDDGLASLDEGEDFSLRTHFLCERAHIQATRGEELLWMQKIEEAKIGVIDMRLEDREKALNQINYIQGEGYKRFAFHVMKDLPMSMRERYAKHAFEQFDHWSGATIELPGFESLVVQVSQAQCLIFLDPDEAISQAWKLEKSVGQHYPTLLDKLHRVIFFAQQRLQMSNSDFLQLFKEPSHGAYHTGRNML